MVDQTDKTRSAQTIESQLIHHVELPTTTVSRWLDGLIAGIGITVSWFWVVLVGVILYAVIGRYFFDQGSVLLEEVQWHLSSFIWLIGLSYALVTDDHVRVDVFHEKLSLRTQAWVELFGLICLLIPFCVIATLESWPYFLSSFQQGETSQAPAGLPYRWAIKFVMTLAFVLLGIAALARVLKCTALLFGWPAAELPKAVDEADSVDDDNRDERDARENHSGNDSSVKRGD